LIQTFFFFISNFFLNFFVIKILDPDWIGIRIGIQPKMLDTDPDPYQMNTETLHDVRGRAIISMNIITGSG
jgi:hypothetical protein